ncbi:MAG: hypothetical protein DHS20C02_03470 [Micavibrio sp.]|nr:MAG: hypothetical protein DHS20C02_03470 [Micavibrio sp.]
MKIFKIIFGLAALVLIGGFGYFAIIDVQPPQSEVVKTIPNERFFNEK